MPSVLSYFPHGLRILVIDSDEASLKEVVQKLQECKCYTVTPCTKARSALDILNRARGEFDFDLLLTEIRIADMDGLSLLQHVRENFDVPTVIMSAEKKTELAVECLNSGACFYLDKPIQCSALANIWQHAIVTRRPNMCTETREMELLFGQSSSYSDTGELDEQRREETLVTSPTEEPPAQEEGEEQVDVEVEEANADGEDEEMTDNSLDDGDDREEDTDDGRPEEGNNKVDVHVNNCDDVAKEKKKAHRGGKRKKARVVWTGELHQLFLGAIEKLGIDRAAPRKILELMKRPELTRAHVASHLQKFRQYLRRKVEGKESGIGRSSRFLMSRRKSVFDSTPIMSILNFKNQMDMTPKAPADPGSHSTNIPSQSTSHRLSSPILLPKSSTIETAYMGFSLRVPQHQQNPRSLGLQNTRPLLFDGRPRSMTNLFCFESHGGFSSLPSYGMHYDPGKFKAAGSSNLLDLLGNNNNNNVTSALWTKGFNPLGMARIGLPSPKLATGYGAASYVGLQLETATRQLGFSQNGSTFASDMFLQDFMVAEPNVTIDYGLPEQLMKGDHHLSSAAPSKRKVDTTFQKSTEVIQDSPQQIDLSISLVQNDSSVTTNGSSNGAPTVEVTSPPENVKAQQNELSVNDFTGIGFNLEDDITFESFTSLLFDQEHDVGTLVRENTNFTTTTTEGDDDRPIEP